MQLRYYQQEAVNSIYHYFQEHDGNPVIAMPTGTGKSLVIGDFIKGVYQNYPGQRIMMLTHVKKLIEQNMEKLLILWPTAPAGVYSAGLKRKEHSNPITFAGIASVAKKAELFGHQDLVVIDECHLLSPNANTMYGKFISNLKEVNPNLKVVGLSATPYRLGQGILTEGGIFTDLCYDITGIQAFRKLIQEGFLAPLIPKRTKTELDLDSVRMHGGEFIQKDLQYAVDRDEVTYTAVREMVELGQDRKSWLIFATGIEHSEHVCAMLESFGIEATFVHSKLSDTENELRWRDFTLGKYRAIVNKDMLTTGVDHPSLDLIGMLRPTHSPALWVQMLGRGTRPFEGKENCLVLDFAGNTKRLGPIDDPVMPKKKGEGGGGVAPVRLCEQCDTYIHASLTLCPHCGFVFPRTVNLAAHASEEALLTKSEEPEVVDFKVDRVVYGEHKKPNRPTSLKVTYYSGLRRFSEWVCLEHPGFAKKKAHSWWRDRSIQEPPETIAECLPLVEKLRTPILIKVWINKKYPEVMSYEYED